MAWPGHLLEGANTRETDMTTFCLTYPRTAGLAIWLAVFAACALAESL